MRKQLVGLILTPILLVGCQPVSQKEQGQIVGAVLGGIVGRELGDNTTSTIAGSILGGYVGGQLVEHWSQESEKHVSETLNNYQNQSTGSSWHEKGEYYVMRAEKVDPNDCRDFTLKVTEGNQPAKLYKGKACRKVQSNGYKSWVID